MFNPFMRVTEAQGRLAPLFTMVRAGPSLPSAPTCAVRVVCVFLRGWSAPGARRLF